MPAVVKRKIPSTPEKPDFRVRALVVTAFAYPDCARAPTAEIASNASLLAGVVFPDILRNSDLKKLRILRFQVPQTSLLEAR